MEAASGTVAHLWGGRGIYHARHEFQAALRRVCTVKDQPLPDRFPAWVDMTFDELTRPAPTPITPAARPSSLSSYSMSQSLSDAEPQPQALVSFPKFWDYLAGDLLFVACVERNPSGLPVYVQAAISHGEHPTRAAALNGTFDDLVGSVFERYATAGQLRLPEFGQFLQHYQFAYGALRSMATQTADAGQVWDECFALGPDDAITITDFRVIFEPDGLLCPDPGSEWRTRQALEFLVQPSRVEVEVANTGPRQQQPPVRALRSEDIEAPVDVGGVSQRRRRRCCCLRLS
ncbi:Uncharacterized protein PBTT_03395 [Plasmodiophora brassicae]|uniref:Uncharacterized protein n=1 Tax=Plasmodiophora brassicae TaxID=37360 RepID=A0A3P3Y888_PLABS|nr:unnamed protein product [Plasmodiophora brassicae]